ncbi:hypothetical protein GOP47_0018456 [Adiantum capillus-veneris]|uniref:Uncharacterized protein n=1 Tax=Adiantum capillus-veneris TaxID=13818 RepID=A0A9D4UDT7_ADICA|nr:hypothetical protein GOP47_0018456 [Adiantum capillus-veneris]
MLNWSSGPLISAGRRVLPALGIGWSHCVNTRLFLSRTYLPDKQEHSQDRHTGTTEISCQSSSNPHYTKLKSGGMKSVPHVSVLDQLESELPDDLLLTLPHQGPALLCNGIADKPNVSYCCDGSEADEISCRDSSQNAYSSKNSWTANSSSLPSCRVKRTLQVVFAPHLPASSCEFTVTAKQKLYLLPREHFVWNPYLFCEQCEQGSYNS